MIYQTHVQIAETILKELNPFSRTYISSKEFIKGSNHPDYDLYYRFIKHQYEGSIGVVRDLLIEVTTKKLSRYERGFKMGIVAHFLADYMCSYHSNPYYSRKNLATHIRYEQKLHKETKDVSIFDETLFKSKDIDGFIVEIADFILINMHTIEISKREDLKRAMSIVNHMVQLVLNIIMPQKELQNSDHTQTRIAIFTDTYYPQINGVSNTVYHYMKYLETQYIPYVLICPKYKSLMEDKEVGYHIVRVKSISFPFYKESKVAFPNKKKLNQLLEDFKPTNIHVMTEFSIGHFGLKYGKKHHIPVVTNYSTHFVSYLDYLKLGFLKKPLKKYVSWFHNQSRITTCPSSETKKHLQSIGIEKTTIFGRGIYTDQFSPQFRSDAFRHQFHTQPFIYLYVGRVSGEKELHLGLEAFTMMKKTMDQIVFLVVGDGPKKAAYEKQYKDVHFLGYKTGEELSMIYASSDVFVFPSPTETLGNVVLEAMASGLPVIVANQGGVLENVKHLQNGMIASKQDVESYYEHMKTYFDDQHHFRLTRSQALEDVKKKSWQDIFKDQLNMHQSLHMNEDIK
ncbi:MAG: glycosyltransferase [Firmicutes bacterium]|nr:glycosyltransferase [Bacillota bacterium]